MPPEVLLFRPSLTPLVHFSPTPAQETQPSVHKHCRGNRRMKINTKKLIPILVLMLSIISILRLLRLTVTSSSSSAGLSALPPANVSLHKPRSSKQPTQPPNIANLTEKEFRVLSTLVAQRRPCNLLIFGFQPQYLNLSLINAGGSTVFLEDDPAEVYEKNWDVMVIDGPSGDSPEAQGRMASIFTAGVLARAGQSSDVLVHDVDRMIEKWFSWEFLCDENLFYSKGKLWHFKIRGHLNATRFCTAGVQTAEQ